MEGDRGQRRPPPPAWGQRRPWGAGVKEGQGEELGQSEEEAAEEGDDDEEEEEVRRVVRQGAVWEEAGSLTVLARLGSGKFSEVGFSLGVWWMGM